MFKNQHTIYELQKWAKKDFEKLGWMVLAKENNDNYKLLFYKKSLDHLLDAIANAIEEYDEDDRKHDLMVTWNKVKILRHFVSQKFK